MDFKEENSFFVKNDLNLSTRWINITYLVSSKLSGKIKNTLAES